MRISNTTHRSARSRTSSSVRRWIAILSLFAGLLAVLEFVLPWAGARSFLLPRPSAVGTVLVEQFGQQAFWDHTLTTMVELFGGLLVGALAGFVLGVLLTQSTYLETLLMPYIVALQAVPKVALAPMMIVSVGYGIRSKVVLAAIIAFFPVLINVMAGIRSVEQDRIDLMRQLRATRSQTLRWLLLPAAMPAVMAGLRIAATFAMIGAIVGEFTGASKGLGALLLQFNFNFDQPGVFAVLVFLSIIAIVIDLGLRALTDRLVFWQRQEKATGGGTV